MKGDKHIMDNDKVGFRYMDWLNQSEINLLSSFDEEDAKLFSSALDSYYSPSKRKYRKQTNNKKEEN